ncbi:hypothetical protein I350_07878 [Cryptococcus amylolentus CBS 6273]|uniref:SUZ domain-containing protein n=1 Tax=Cryptococcus amylolentus CBS 6273 TaxID=1296118 RepID=A0A1E3JBL5_9TREE|nr:hypothetical protein I350_07878 [Cryptococcus amylolentus CBS 6273]
MSIHTDDDWETSDIVPKKILRPTANTFNPTPRPLPPTWGPPQIPAGPSYSYLPAQQRQRVAEGEEDDWFRGDRRPQNNRQIWDSANTKPKTPSILSPQILPQPQVQLLRRTPSHSSPNSSGTSSPTGDKVKSYEERQEEYRLARERIFGAEGAVEGSGSSKPAPPATLAQRQRSQDNQPRRQDPPSQTHQPFPQPLPFAGLVPTQVRASPSPSLSPSASPYNSHSRPPTRTHSNPSVAGGGVIPSQGGGSGLVRQPIGPGQGAGFGGASGFGGYGRGA